jgi:hypothetical protein
MAAGTADPYRPADVEGRGGGDGWGLPHPPALAPAPYLPSFEPYAPAPVRGEPAPSCVMNVREPVNPSAPPEEALRPPPAVRLYTAYGAGDAPLDAPCDVRGREGAVREKVSGDGEARALRPRLPKKKKSSTKSVGT